MTPVLASVRSGSARNLLVMYWGRRGMSHLASSIAAGAKEALPDARVILSFSKYVEDIPEVAADIEVFPVDLFQSSFGVFSIWKIPFLIRDLCSFVSRNQISVVVDVIPHVWVWPVYLALRRRNVRIVTIAHDDVRHPGDPLALIRQLADLALAKADIVVTLSHSVAQNLERMRAGLKPRILTLFHPLKHVAAACPQQLPETLRVLFLGRILPYKGLDLFLDAVELLRARGRRIEAGVFGEGSLGAYSSQIKRLNIECINRWLSDHEIECILARYDVLVASHRQASQSGVVAAALGSGLPCVVTPVGGLVEQVRHGETGFIAESVTSAALADSIERWFLKPAVMQDMQMRVRAIAQLYSGKRFVEAILSTLAERQFVRDPQSKESCV